MDVDEWIGKGGWMVFTFSLPHKQRSIHYYYYLFDAVFLHGTQNEKKYLKNTFAASKYLPIHKVHRFFYGLLNSPLLMHE